MAQTIAGVNIAISADTAALIRETAKASQAIQRNTQQMAQSFQKVETMAQRAQRAVVNATGGFLTLSAAKAGAQAAMNYADAWQEASNKIAASQQISGTQARSLERITDLSNAVRAPIADVTDLYSKLLRVSSQVGASELQVAQATETVAKAFKAGGASTLEQVNGIRQLAQALGSGILQGDELRSIRENAPLIAKAIAEEFNTTIAGLKEMGAAGQLESERVFKAILKGKAEIDAAFAKTDPTFADQFTRLDNAITEYIGKASQGSMASNGLKTAIGLLADNFEPLANSIMNSVANLTLFNVNLSTLYGLAQKIMNLADTAPKAPGAAAHRIAPGGAMGPLSGLGDVPTFEKDGKGGGGHSGHRGALPILEATAELKAYEEAAKAAGVAEDEWATHTALTDHGKMVKDVYRDLPNMIGDVMSPLELYREEMERIGIAETHFGLEAERAFAMRKNAVLGLVQTTLGAAGAVSGALASLFKENKAFAIANAVINTAEAITSALKNPPGPPFSYVYAAAAAISGAAQISAIMSAQPGSGKVPSVKGGKGSKASSSAVSGAGDAASGKGGLQQSIILQIKGDVFGPDHFRKIVEGINGVQRDGTALIRLA